MKHLSINHVAFGSALLLHGLLMLAGSWKKPELSEPVEKITFRFVAPREAEAPVERAVAPAIIAPPREAVKKYQRIEKENHSLEPAMPAPAPAPPVREETKVLQPEKGTEPVRQAVSEARPVVASSPAGNRQVAAPVTKTDGSRQAGEARKADAGPAGGSRLGEYLALVRSMVENRKEYPSQARQLGFQGTVTLRISIKATGSLANVTIVSSSGHRILDKAAVSAIKNAAPFRPTAGFGLGDVVVEVPISYRLN